MSSTDAMSNGGARRLRYVDVRPYAAPDDLAQLDGPVAGEVELPRTLAWGPKRRFQLDDTRDRDRQRLYQTVIREASTTGELARYLNRTLVERMHRRRAGSSGSSDFRSSPSPPPGSDGPAAP